MASKPTTSVLEQVEALWQEGTTVSVGPLNNFRLVGNLDRDLDDLNNRIGSEPLVLP